MKAIKDKWMQNIKIIEKSRKNLLSYIRTKKYKQVVYKTVFN